MAGSSIVNAAASVPQLTIRQMTAADIPAVAALEEAIYPQPWPVGVFRDELEQDGRIYRVATVEGRVVGYGGMMIVVDDAHVTTLAVEENARRFRLGTRLMLELLDGGLAQGARHLTLEVRMSNKGAQQLYSKFGMAPVGVRKDYYRDEDALIMWATDIDAAEYQGRIGRIKEQLGD